MRYFSAHTAAATGLGLLLCAAAPAIGVVTGNIEYRFVTVAGAMALPNQGSGLANGLVLGPNTVIAADNPLIRQRVALQARTVNIAGNFTGQSFNATNTALDPSATILAQNLGLFGMGGSLSMADGQLVGVELNAAPFSQQAAGTVVGSSWSGFAAALPSGPLPSQVWPAANPLPPSPNNPAGTGVGGGWVDIARFSWESSDFSPRVINNTFTPNTAATSALVGNSVTNATFPDSIAGIDGQVTYAPVAAALPVSGTSFGFIIEACTCSELVSVPSPATVTADPLVNPDASNVELATFFDTDGANISVTLNSGDLAALVALGADVSIPGNFTGAPRITLTWDAPAAAIGSTYVLRYTFANDLVEHVGQTSVTVVPAPTALAALAMGTMLVRRRRR